MKKSMERTKAPKLRWLMVPLFLITGIFFQIIMIVPICMGDWFPNEMIVPTLIFVVPLFGILVQKIDPPPKGKKKYRWLDLLDRLLQMQSYRKKCRHLYQMQGFSKFRWYALHWIGPLWMVASLFLFFHMDPQNRPFWILSAGFVGWCVFFRLQIGREYRWCSEAGPIDLNFINKEIITICSLYVIFLYFFHTFGTNWSKIQTISTVMVTIIQPHFSSYWLHLCMGQRRMEYIFGSSLQETDRYGEVGKPLLLPPISSSERKKILMIGKFINAILIIISLFFIYNYLIYGDE